MIIESKSSMGTRRFKASSTRILRALHWLKGNNEDYAHIKIDLEALAAYSKDHVEAHPLFQRVQRY